MQVFISYSRKDATFVDELTRALEFRGYDVWVDREDMSAGGEDRWRRSVVKAIRESDVVVLVLSPNSTTSQSVERELTVAADNARRVVPLMYQPCVLPDGFQYELAGVQYVDFTAMPFDDAVVRLASQVGPPDNATDVAESALPSAGFPPPDVAPRSRGNTYLFVGAGVIAVALIGAAVWVTASGGDEDGTNADTAPPSSSIVTPIGLDPPATSLATSSTSTDAQSESSGAVKNSTAPTVVVSREETEAVALVQAWADATTRRDFAAAAAIDTSRPAEALEGVYRAADDPVRMISVQPYVTEVVPDGPLWRVTGASFIYDYNREPVIRTHVICLEWIVDLTTGRFTPKSTGEKFFEAEQIPPDQFAATFAAVCAPS